MAKRSKGNFSAGPLVKLFYLLLVLVVLLATATYTWFSLSKAPKVHDMALYISSAKGVMLSADKTLPWEEWELHLDYSEYMPENTILRPATWSDTEGIFYAVDFGVDGRIRGISYDLDDERNANGTDSEAYYVKYTFYARSDYNMTVSLAAPTDQTGNFVVGMPEWDSEEVIHNDGGQGAQSSIRIGFRITRFDKNGDPLDEAPAFIIYEPNCDAHLDYSRDYKATPSIDGTQNLVPAERLIRQTATAWTEADPVQYNVVIYNYGEFIDSTKLFDIDKGQTAQIDLYLWLEGQDEDCANKIGQAAKIIAGIHFDAKSRDGSGMDEIE